MTRSSRREFLEGAALTAAAAAAAPSLLAARRPARRETLRVAVIGVRGRGRAHIGAFKAMAGVEVAAICDCDEGVIGPAAKAVPDARFVRDVRELLDDESIHAVSIATPNHWHSLAAIWALEAGKHVYVEKPLSHDVGEGRALVEAARRTGLVVQHGTQSRSSGATRDALAWLREGGLGEVKVAHALCYKRRKSIGKVAGPQALPKTLDHDLWTGPAALEPLGRTNLHYDWHWVWNTGNGDVGNQGVHQMDIARWGLGLEGLPRTVTSAGGRVGYDDDGNTPNTLVTDLDYGERHIVFEVRGLETGAYRGANIGVVFHGEAGYLVSSSYEKVSAYDHDGREIALFEGGGNHFQNFVDAVRESDPSRVNASVLDGHVSSALCHLGNVSYQLASVAPAGQTSSPMTDALERMTAHLAENGVERSLTAAGPTLALAEGAERFVGAHAGAADALLHRADRAPFVVPGRATTG